MLVWSWVERRIVSVVAGGEGGGAGGIWMGARRWNVGIAVGVTAMAGVALVAALVISSRRGTLRSPWSQRRRKWPLSRQQWESFFAPDGKLQDGVKFLIKVRSGGIEPSIRSMVWPFLLGVYDLNSSEAERDAARIQKRKEYKKLRRKCCLLLKSSEGDEEIKKGSKVSEDRINASKDLPVPFSEDESSAEQILVNEEMHAADDPNTSLLGNGTDSSSCVTDADEKSEVTVVAASREHSETSDSESSVEDSESFESPLTVDRSEENDQGSSKLHSLEKDSSKSHRTTEDFATWQRIIRLDAIRANDEWIPYSPKQAEVSVDRGHRFAKKVGLRDYEHLETCRIYHAARLVAILEAYAVYDPEIGYCQGMSDLLSPILAVIEEDYEAFWCFVGFMRKSRHNFRLDEVGIRRQLNTVSKIIKSKDADLYRHLVKLQAEDCFFVYRMVVVLFRRELNFEQTLCLWEVMWADQAALRAGIGNSAWGRIRLRAPPTDDLLLYAVAASVLQKRKLIIEKYSSMDEIMRECNSMAGQLDVWKLLDDAHDLVVSLHDSVIESHN